jgi:hypothetical protein
MNDTCAETAKEIPGNAGIDKPSGYGAVKHSKILPFSISYSVNPYKWHANFRAGGFAERVFENPSTPAGWTPPVNEGDPIFVVAAK